MEGTKWVALIGAGLLSGAMAFAQTNSTQQTYPQTTTTQSTSPQAGASATASPSGVSGSVSGTALPQSTSSTTQSGAQSTSQPAAPGQASPQGTSQPAAAPGQTSNPQNSAPQGTTTYTTTTQTTVPQSSQPANAAPQTSTSPGTTAGSSAATVPGAVASTGQPEVLIDPAKIYNDKQPISWVGKPVVLQNVMIQDTNDTGNFWVGSDGHHRLLVVKQDSNPNLKAMRFHKGDIVSISGTVQPASKYMAQATTETDGSMHDAEKSSGVFLLADNVTVASSTHK
jgi:hypothetical protein